MERQLEDCERLAERKGWVIVERLRRRRRERVERQARPEYARCLERSAAGAIDGLLVYDLDRLHRQPRELEDFIDLCEQLRLTNVASVSGDIDLTTADGQFQARILAAVAKKESDDKSRRIRRKHEELAVDGKRLRWREQSVRLRRRPARRVRPAEAAIVRECARRFLAGSRSVPSAPI